MHQGWVGLRVGVRGLGGLASYGAGLGGVGGPVLPFPSGRGCLRVAVAGRRRHAPLSSSVLFGWLWLPGWVLSFVLCFQLHADIRP